MAYPLFSDITIKKESFKDAEGKTLVANVPLVTLPAGTVLFRGVQIPNLKKGHDVRYFYRDFLGNPDGPENICLSPIHNVFFYPFPFIPFGIDGSKNFQSMQAVVLVHPVTVICSISPSRWVRAISKTKAFTGDAPFQRCPAFRDKYTCPGMSEKEKDGLKWDSCLHPKYQERTGVRGWMAIANKDSLEPHRTNEKPSESPMGKYVKNLEKKFPGRGSELVTKSYKDFNDHFGFPEFALYPYREHKGEKNIIRRCPTEGAALALIEKEALSNNLNFLPLATFTRDGVVDMVNGHYSYDCLTIGDDSFNELPLTYHSTIEKKVNQWMTMLEKDGLNLPLYGSGKLTFDTRTGFYVLPQMVSKKFTMDGATPYSSLLLPLSTPEEKKKVLEYTVLFRKFFPAQKMKPFEINGSSVPRAFLFERVPDLDRLFKELEMVMPKDVSSLLEKATAQQVTNEASEPPAPSKKPDAGLSKKSQAPPVPGSTTASKKVNATRTSKKTSGGGRRKTRKQSSNLLKRVWAAHVRANA